VQSKRRIVLNMSQQPPPLPSGPPPEGAALLAGQPKAAMAVLALAVAGWVFLLWLVFDMGHPLAQLMMPGTAQWGLASTLAVFAMWALMMAAMMLPSALPMILTFVHLSARSGAHARGRAFVAAYIIVWSAFSLAATALQWALQAIGWVDAMAASTSATLTALVLLIAGIYQFSPLKRVCLSSCRTPFGFLMGEWRAGRAGAFVMGLRHGLLCVGCCWALMALLFVGGVMNLAWIAALSIVVAIEKLAPRGERIAVVLGVGLIAAGVIKLAALLA
jgi:predicted metal-binding membrane protein